MTELRTVTTICTGNICRSPMAEAFLGAHLAELGVHDVLVQSAGTHAKRPMERPRSFRKNFSPAVTGVRVNRVVCSMGRSSKTTGPFFYPLRQADKGNGAGAMV